MRWVFEHKIYYVSCQRLKSIQVSKHLARQLPFVLTQDLLAAAARHWLRSHQWPGKSASLITFILLSTQSTSPHPKASNCPEPSPNKFWICAVQQEIGIILSPSCKHALTQSPYSHCICPTLLQHCSCFTAPEGKLSALFPST